MNTLQDVISNESMISLRIDSSSFVSVIKKLNEIIKSQESRITQLEENSQNYVTKIEFSATTQPLINDINEVTKKSKEALLETEAMKRESRQNNEELTKMIDDRFNEILFTTNLNTKSAMDQVQSNFEEVRNQIRETNNSINAVQFNYKSDENATKEIKANVDLLGQKIYHVNTEFIKFVNSSSSDLNLRNIKSPITPIQTPGLSQVKEDIVTLSNRIQRLETHCNNAQQQQNSDDLSSQIQKIYEQISDQLNEKLTTLQSAITIALNQPIAGPQDGSGTLDDVWKVVNKNREVLLNAMAEHNLLVRRVDVMQSVLDHIQQTSNPESPVKPMFNTILAHQKAATAAANGGAIPLDNDIRLKEHKQLASTVDGLGGQMATALQDILKIKNVVNRNEKDVRDVVLAIIDEFKLIRTNASGLENLPPLNLANCVPSFFNNPSFTFERGESGASSPSESERSFGADEIRGSRNVRGPRRGDSDEPANRRSREYYDDEDLQPVYHSKKISGLMHLVSRPEGAYHRMPRDESHQRLAKGSHSSSVTSCTEEEAPAKTSRSITSQQTLGTVSEGGNQKSSPRQPETIIKQEIIQSVDRESLEEARRLMLEFNKNKDELMAAVDRKVDRDMVERLFNKFRTIVTGLNERVRDMAANMNKFATAKDMAVVAEAVSAFPVVKEATKFSVDAAKISPRVEFAGGTASVSVSVIGECNEDKLPPLREKTRAKR